MNLKKIAAGILVAGTLSLGLVACNDDPACAAGPSAPRPPAPAVRAPAPKAPAVKPAAPKAPVSKPTVYKTRYDSNGYPVVYPVIVDDDLFEGCDD